MTTRRSFVKSAGVGLLALGTPTFLKGIPNLRYKKEELFKLGIAGFSFVNFNIDDTLQMMKRMKVHYLCIKDFHLPFDSTDEQIKTFHAKLKSNEITGYGVGPIYMNSQEDVEKGFAYAKRVGVKLIVGVPKHETLPYIEKKVKEYDFHYAIHIHGPDIELYPHAKDVMEHIDNLDSRIGICLDIGHDARAGFDPVKDLKLYHQRIFDVHIKDVTAANKKGGTCEMGRGVLDIPAFVRMLRNVKYRGTCSLEFEKDMKDPLAGLAESIGYFKGVTDATR